MTNQFILRFSGVAGVLAIALGLVADRACAAGTEAKHQSEARPFGLDIVAPVMRRGSDSAAKNFLRSQNYHDFRSMLTGDLTSTFDDVDHATVMLDPSRLTLQNDYQARAYFIQEDAGYHNSFGFVSTDTAGRVDRKLIFPDASQGSRRSKSTPLKSGDFVDFGNFTGGTKLDFFLIADGANGGANVFSTDAATNPDGVRHVLSHAFADRDSPYLMLAFEDIYGGGDEDFNDLIVALDIGAANVQNVIKTVGAPEPTTFVTLAAFVALGARLRRRGRSES